MSKYEPTTLDGLTGRLNTLLDEAAVLETAAEKLTYSDDVEVASAAAPTRALLRNLRRDGGRLLPTPPYRQGGKPGKLTPGGS